MVVTEFVRIASTGAVRAAVLVTPSVLVTSIGNDVRLFVEDDTDDWGECGRHPFSRFGGTAAGITLLGKIEKGTQSASSVKNQTYFKRNNLNGDEQSSNAQYLVSAFGVRKLRFFLVSIPESSAVANSPVLRPIGSCYDVDDLVLDVKSFGTKLGGLRCGNGETFSTNDKESKLFEMTLINEHVFTVAVAYAHNYIDFGQLRVNGGEVDSKHHNFKLFTLLGRIKCSDQSLLYSLDLSVEVFSQDIIRVYVAAGTADSRISLWKIQLSKEATSDANYLSISAAASSCTSLCDSGRSIFCYSPQTLSVVTPYQSLSGHRGGIFRLKFIHARQLLISASDDRDICIWRRNDCWRNHDELDEFHEGNSPDPVYSIKCVLKGHHARVWDFCLVNLENQDVLVSAGEDSQCFVWSLKGSLLYKLWGHAGRGVRVVTSSELSSIASNRWAVSINSNNVYIRSYCRRNCHFHCGSVATGGEDGDLKVWDLDSFIQKPSDVCMSSGGQDRDQDECLQIDIKNLGDTYNKDWIRDVSLLSHQNGILVTNFGGIGIFDIKSSLLRQVEQVTPRMKNFSPKFIEQHCDSFLNLGQPLMLSEREFRDLLNTKSSTKSCRSFLEQSGSNGTVSITHIYHWPSIFTTLTVSTAKLICTSCFDKFYGVEAYKQTYDCIFEDSLLLIQRIALIGTANGSCLALPTPKRSYNDCGSYPNISDEKFMQLIKSSTKWKVFDSCRVQKIFALSVVPSSYYAHNSGTPPFLLFHLICVTNHLGFIKFYLIDSKPVSSHQQDSTEPLFLGECQLVSYRRETRLFSAAWIVSDIGIENDHLIKCEIILLLGDEHGDLHLVSVRVFYDINNKFPYNKSLHTSQIKLLTKFSQLHQKEKIHHIEILTPQNIPGHMSENSATCISLIPVARKYQIQTTGGDGTIRVSDWYYSAEALDNPMSYQFPVRLRLTTKLPKLKTLWSSFHLNSNQYVLAFKLSDFVVWNKTSSAVFVCCWIARQGHTVSVYFKEVWRFRCGGSRRPFSQIIHHEDSLGLLTTVSVTGTRLYVRQRRILSKYPRGFNDDVNKSLFAEHIEHSMQPPDSRTSCELEDTKIATTTVSGVDCLSQIGNNNMFSTTTLVNHPCVSLIGGLHGREIWNVKFLSDDLLCTAGEDNTVRLIQLRKNDRNRGPRNRRNENKLSSLRCVQVCSDHLASVRCLGTCRVFLEQNSYESKTCYPISFLVTGGARQTINLYYHIPSDNTLQNDRLNHLCRHLLPANNDERIMSLSVEGLQIPASTKSSMHSNIRDISLHVFLGMSSGRLLHLYCRICVTFHPSGPIKQATSLVDPLSCELQSYNLTVEVVVLETPIQSPRSNLWSKPDNNALQLYQLDQLSSSALSSELALLTNLRTSDRFSDDDQWSRHVLLLVGCSVGFVHLYLITIQTTEKPLSQKRGRLEFSKCHQRNILFNFTLLQKASYKPHQVGTNALKLYNVNGVVNGHLTSEKILANSLPSKSENVPKLIEKLLHSSLDKPVSPKDPAAIIKCQTMNLEKLPIELHASSSKSETKSERLLVSDTSVEASSVYTFLVVSCGDDNSLVLQHLDLIEDSISFKIKFIGQTLIPRAHTSSVRDIALQYPYVLSIGWDRFLRIWEIFHDENTNLTNTTPPDNNDPLLLNAFSHSLNSISTSSLQLKPSSVLNFTMQLLNVIPLGVPDVACIASHRIESHTRLAISGGASGLEIIDVFLK